VNKLEQVALQVPKYFTFRLIGFPKMFPMNVTLSLLYKCNSRCKTCNIWRKSVKNFTLEEFDETLRSMGTAPYWFTLSGGEPFLRDDIVEICRSIYSNCKPGIITIPTNGSLSSIIPGRVDEIARSCRGTRVVVNLSLDGVGQKHDLIRGFKGSFRNCMETYHALKSLNRENLTVGIHSVISVFNANDASELFSFISSLRPDSYITEIAEERVELGTVGTNLTPSLNQYADAIDPLLHNSSGMRFERLGKVTSAFRREYYGLVKDVLRRKTQVIPCYAGWASAQISPDGDVWACCIRAEPLGNLRDVKYDFSKIWYGETAKVVRTNIRNKQCYCPMANASYTNMLLSPRMLLPILLRLLLEGTCEIRSRIRVQPASDSQN